MYYGNIMAVTVWFRVHVWVQGIMHMVDQFVVVHWHGNCNSGDNGDNGCNGDNGDNSDNGDQQTKVRLQISIGIRSQHRC